MDWRVRAGPRNKPTAREREGEEREATHMPFRDWYAHCMMGRGRARHHVSKKRSDDLSGRTNDSHGLFLSQAKFHCELSNEYQMSQSRALR